MGYPSDLKDKEWQLIEPYFKPQDRRGNASKHPRRRIVDAILYVVKAGVQWRMLPKDFPPWQTVYDHYAKWNKRGVWEAALDRLNARYRKKSSAKSAPATASSTHRAPRRRTPARRAGSTAASG